MYKYCRYSKMTRGEECRRGHTAHGVDICRFQAGKINQSARNDSNNSSPGADFELCAQNNNSKHTSKAKFQSKNKTKIQLPLSTCLHTYTCRILTNFRAKIIEWPPLAKTAAQSETTRTHIRNNLMYVEITKSCRKKINKIK